MSTSSSLPALPPDQRSTTVSFDTIVGTLRGAGCVFAEDEARLLIAAARTPAALAALVDRRVAGLPLEHLLGWAEFCGLRIAVDPGVFVPRRRTEFLVRQALSLLNDDGAVLDGGGQDDDPAGLAGSSVPIVLDLCCGSGAVGVALAAGYGQIELHAVDIDPAAAQCAGRNIRNVDGQVYLGDLYDALPGELRGRVDVVLANAPYVPTADIELMPTEARLHEPRLALDGGADGLDVQRRVAADALSWLAPSGHLLMESSERQAPITVAIFAGAGLTPRVARSEDLGATVVVGHRPPAGRGETQPNWSPVS